MNLANRSFVQTTSTLLVVGLMALLGIVAMSYWLGVGAQVNFEDVIAARNARSVASELRSALQTAESSQRGFLVTGNEIYLAPYDTAKTYTKRRLEEFKKEFAGYAAQGPLVARLTETIAEKLAEMDETIALRRDRRDDEAEAVFRTNRGKALMDEANVLLSGAIAAADDRLTASVTQYSRKAGELRWYSIIGGVVVVLVVGAAAASGYRYARDLRAARDEVSALNEGLEARVRERTEQVMRANEEVQRFAYIVTHDLRAPLVNIMGFTSEMESGLGSLQSLVADLGDGIKGPLAEEARTAANEDLPEAISFIRSSTKKMDGLINAILRISREGRRSLRPEPVDLRQLIEASANALQHQLDAAEGSIDINLKVPVIRSDRLSLEQVFGNIFDNAIKFRYKDRPVKITVDGGTTTGGQLYIDIADNGRGIAEHDLERVFELFRRSGAQDQPGEGIGLAYVRTVMRNLGGDITVKSVLGEGTTFHLVLPVFLVVNEELVRE